MKLSVIIPAYNESKRIGLTLESVGAWLDAQGGDAEIIVVNNRSTDATADVVREFKKRFPFVRMIDEKRPGKGYAVAAGMLFATGEVRVFMDADNSTSIDHLAKALPLIASGYGVVIGSLAVRGAHIIHGEPGWRVFLGKLGNLWIQLWAVPGVRDTQRGFKVFTAAAANDIFSRLTIYGWGFDVEVLALARAHHYRIAEIPVTWNNPVDTRVNVWAYPKVLLDTVRIGINRIRGRYRA